MEHLNQRVYSNGKKLKSAPFEAHHIIPIDILQKNPELKKLLFELQKSDPNFNFDFNSIDNGIMIQKKSLILDQAGHGSHKAYSDAIDEKITTLIRDAGDDNIQAMVNIKKLIKDTKAVLRDEVLLGNKSVNDIVNFK